MFVKHMSGEDEVGWKTLYLAQDLHSKYEKFTLDNYRKSLRIMYPYRDVCIGSEFVYTWD